MIAEVEVKDPDRYKEYTSQVLATIERYGGRFIVRGGAAEELEGEWKPKRIVVIEFPDMSKLRAWHSSAEYAPLLKLRQSASSGRFIAVQGV
jgi:uncharacterized protein (DUF1330 family)